MKNRNDQTGRASSRAPKHDLTLFVALWISGAPVQQIACECALSRNAVIGRAVRLNLSLAGRGLVSRATREKAGNPCKDAPHSNTIPG